MSIEEKIKTAKEDSWLKDSVSEKEFKEIKDNERRMSREEAIEYLKRADTTVGKKMKTRTAEAIEMAIRALKNEQTDGDFISRQKAIDTIEALYLDGDSVVSYLANADGDTLIGKYQAITALDDLPPVTPQPNVKQTDGDFISRTDLLNKIWQKEYGKDYDGVNLLNIPHIDIIENMPSAEKTAEWIVKTDDRGTYGICSNCGMKQYVGLLNYCSDCGCKMKNRKRGKI